MDLSQDPDLSGRDVDRKNSRGSHSHNTLVFEGCRNCTILSDNISGHFPA